MYFWYNNKNNSFFFMETRNLGIVAVMATVIAIAGLISINSNSIDAVGKLAVDYDTVDVSLRNDENIFVVDIRSVEHYQTGHIAGASHDVLAGETLEKRVKNNPK